MLNFHVSRSRVVKMENSKNWILGGGLKIEKISRGTQKILKVQKINSEDQSDVYEIEESSEFLLKGEKPKRNLRLEESSIEEEKQEIENDNEQDE